jgi:hypothetical protein
MNKVLFFSILTLPLFSQPVQQVKKNNGSAPMPVEQNKPAQEEAASSKAAAAAKRMGGAERSFMMIDAATRAADYKAAFDMLKKDKITNKISFHLTTGEVLSNISDITLAENSSLLIIKFHTVQGNKYQVVPVENIASLTVQS